jgi:hypothetical protein
MSTVPADEDESPDRSKDDRDLGWGDPSEDDDEAVRRLLAEKPPHHAD